MAVIIYQAHISLDDDGSVSTPDGLERVQKVLDKLIDQHFDQIAIFGKVGVNREYSHIGLKEDKS